MPERSEKPSLVGPLAKIARAREHLYDLHRVCDKAIKESTGEPFVEREGDWEVVRVPLREFPLRPSLVSGDYIHNLRSALDHLAWQLVKVSGGKPGSWTAFPSYGHEDDFIRNVKERPKKRGPGPLDGIEKGGAIWALIESHQPYANTKLPSWMPNPAKPRKWMSRLSSLGILNGLSKIDKHRTIHGFNVYPSRGQPINKCLTWNPDAVLVQQKDRESWEPLEDGADAELARFRFRPGVEPNVRVTSPLLFQVGFEAEFEPGESVTVLTPSMQTLGEEIEELILSFAEFFPPG